MLAQMNRRLIEPDITVVELSGRLGLGSSGQSTEWKLQNLADEGVRKLVFDLSALSSIDSMGVGMIVLVAGRLQQAGGEARISGASGLVAQTFGIVQIDRVVKCHPDLESACASFDAAASGA